MLKTLLYSSLRPLFSVKNVEEYYRTITVGNLQKLSLQYENELLAFIAKNNRYYSPLLQNKKKLDDLPVLTKQVIREQFELLKSDNYQAQTYLNSSGGSTGVPQTFLQDMEFSSWSQTAQTYYFRNFLGVEFPRVRKVILWGSERDTFKQQNIKGKIANWLTNAVLLNTFNLKEEDWLRYVHVINTYKPQFIKGYAGSLYQIAKIIKKYNLQIHKPEFLYSSAEMLRDFMRKEIEEVFGVKVYDFYGSREVGAIAGECHQGKRHIFSFNTKVEVVDYHNKPVAAGEHGKLLVTTLHNYSMPLVRYEIGDTGSLGKGKCLCGSDLPWLDQLKGRVTDHFVRRDGTLIHGEYFTHLFYYRPWVEAFQVTQVDYDHIDIYIIKSQSEENKDIQDIEEKIRFLMGKKCKITWHYVDRIPKTPQGKHLFTRCLIDLPPS